MNFLFIAHKDCKRLTAHCRPETAKARRNFDAALSRITLIIGLAAALSACASIHEPACNIGEKFAVQDTLYFGAVKANGTVTPEEWVEFLSASVTPRFPQGLSVWEASGQWRSADGSIVREPSHVLNLVHPDDGVSEKAVLEIVEIYKSRFQQEAVLRVKSLACVSF